MQVVLEDQVDVDPGDEATICEHLHKVVSPQLIACIFVKKNSVHFQEYVAVTG
jgi:double-strand break repair protein MRE11